MKLIFSKNQDNSLNIQMSTGTIEEDFTYVNMIKELLKNNKFEDTVYKDGVSDDEQERIESMLKKINDSIFLDESD